MAGRTGKSQTILNDLLAKRAECAGWMPQKKLQVPEQAVEPRKLVAPKISYRPHTLRPSIIRRICHWPPEKHNSKSKAKVMYINRRFGKCSPAVCHEDICPFTEVCKRHKKIPKRINRIAKKSARNSALPKSKLNSPVSKNATKTPRPRGVYIPRYLP